ncbi:hypothetical protein [Mucilaginibacter flavus]|uniref:hypothetical protein n=1 Tax=Mucilaginibacter flavus TaxID=931504 RepID=UPI0025B591DF|nr:hypothetical protein [Mucilaginibacter flavus]MDN3580917.1 hypothetical protein [Mucilaginibacter flavus]
MNLKRGIQFKSDLENFDEQLSFNSGTNMGAEATGVYYRPNSFIPKNDWRPLDSTAKNILFHKNNQHYSNIVKVGEVPRQLRDTFRTMKLHECTNPDDVYPTVRLHEETVKGLATDLDDFFAGFSAHRQYKFHRITRAMPNRETITCHYIDQKFIYIGLHVDRSRLYKPHTAHKSGNRISINLGSESRHLATVNLSLIQCYNMIRKKAGAEIVITPGNIAGLFFQYYPEYPVVKIEIKPYQYYIAPTDNFFHDATTMGMQALDITLVYTGIFDNL